MHLRNSYVYIIVTLLLPFLYTSLNTCDVKQTSILLVMYISAVGYVLVGSGIAIKKDNDGTLDYSDIRTALNLQFSGGLITTFFWVSK